MTESFTCGVSRGLPERMGVDRSVVEDPGDPTRTTFRGQVVYRVEWLVSIFSFRHHRHIAVDVVDGHAPACGAGLLATVGTLWTGASRFRGWAGGATVDESAQPLETVHNGVRRGRGCQRSGPQNSFHRPRPRHRCPPVRGRSSTAGCDRPPGGILRGPRHTPIMDGTDEGTTDDGPRIVHEEPGRTSRPRAPRHALPAPSTA